MRHPVSHACTSYDEIRNFRRRLSLWARSVRPHSEDGDQHRRNPRGMTMPQYATLIYDADLDWTAAEQSHSSRAFYQSPKGARICILIPGALSPLIARLRRQPIESQPFKCDDLVRDPRLRQIERFTIGGAQSIIWAVLARAAEQATRLDLRDRFEFRYRRALAPSRVPGASLLIGLVLEHA